MTERHDPIADGSARFAGARPLASADAAPALMTPAERRVLAEERERLLALFEADDRASGVASGAPSYGFVTREEFWVELVETFMAGRLGKAIIREASPRLYDLLRAFLRRSDLPPSGVARARE